MLTNSILFFLVGLVSASHTCTACLTEACLSDWAFVWMVFTGYINPAFLVSNWSWFSFCFFPVVFTTTIPSVEVRYLLYYFHIYLNVLFNQVTVLHSQGLGSVTGIKTGVNNIEVSLPWWLQRLLTLILRLRKESCEIWYGRLSSEHIYVRTFPILFHLSFLSFSHFSISRFSITFDWHYFYQSDRTFSPHSSSFSFFASLTVI